MNSLLNSLDHGLPAIKSKLQSVGSSDYISTTIQSDTKGNHRYDSLVSIQMVKADPKEYRQWLKTFVPSKDGKLSRPFRSHNSVSQLSVPQDFLISCKQSAQLELDRTRGLKYKQPGVGTGLHSLSVIENKSKLKLNNKLSSIKVTNSGPKYKRSLVHSVEIGERLDSVQQERPQATKPVQVVKEPDISEMAQLVARKTLNAEMTVETKPLGYRQCTPPQPQTIYQVLAQQTDLSSVKIQHPDSSRDKDLCFNKSDRIQEACSKMRELIDCTIKKQQVSQLFDSDPELYNSLLEQRKMYTQVKHRQIDDNLYDLIKNKKGYDALNRHQLNCRKIRIPQYKVVKRVNGVEQISFHDVKCNNDIIQLWRKDLESSKRKLNAPSQRVESHRSAEYNNEHQEDSFLIGFDAVENAQTQYQNQIRLKQQLTSVGAVNPMVDYFTAIVSKGMLPKVRGLCKSKECDKVDALVLDQNYIRQDQATALASALPNLRFVRKISLQNCGLTDETFMTILNSIDPYNLVELNISSNPLLTAASYRALASFIDDQRTQLSVLALENNKMGDSNLKLVLEALAQVNTIESLDISQNLISNQGASDVAHLLAVASKLKVLLMRHNKIMGKGGNEIANEVRLSENLQVLDISHNSVTAIGKIPQIPELQKVEHAKKRYQEELEKEEMKKSKLNTQMKKPKQQQWATLFSEAWREAFRQNKSLIHVDLSHNNINKIDVQIIAEGLKENHTIFGLHFMGNSGYIDNQGFLIAADEQHKSDSFALTKLQSLKTAQTKDPNRIQLQVCSNCWICEGWTSVKFMFEPGVSDDTVDFDPFTGVKLHLEIDKFVGDLMLPETEGDTNYVIHRMLPPGTHKYFYSVANKLTVAQDQVIAQNDTKLEPKKLQKLTIQVPEKEQINLEKKYFSDMTTRDSLAPTVKLKGPSALTETLQAAVKKQLAVKWEDLEPDYMEVDIPQTNVIENLQQTNKVYTKDDLKSIAAVPRPLAKELGGRHKLRTPWKFSLSVFKDYKVDTSKILDQAFEQDWQNSKIARIVKDENELEQLKKLLHSKYPKFRESYKQLSGVDPQIGLTCIGSNTFSDVVSQLPGFIDGVNFNLADLDLEFISTNANGKPSKRNPERMLVRHNWMEIFVRLAVTRFVKKEKIASGPNEAMRIMLDNYLNPYLDRFTASVWRKKVLHQEEIDLALKHGLMVLKALYTKFSGKFAAPGAPKYMSLVEFTDLFTDCGIYNESFGSKQVPTMFALSMMTQVDELDQDRHMNMSFAEFVEGFVRVAEQLSIPHLVEDGYTIEMVLDGQVQEQDKLGYMQRKLNHKIESLIHLLCQVHCSKLAPQLQKTIEKYKKIKVFANDIDTGVIKFQ